MIIVYVISIYLTFY